jgi:hypothetical protein
MKSAPERRHFWRSVFQSPVRYSMGAVNYPARLLDVSLKGALLELDPPGGGQVGQAGVLAFDLGQGISISMQTSVAYAKGRHLGLHCDSIDLDSMTHLRRLVELNSGEAGILDRELANLLTEGQS